MGLAPYIFTSSSHISFTLTLAMPIRLGRIVFSIKNQYNNLFAHLVPRGTPVALMPVIVIIETVRNVIRPGTLSIRLAANSSRAFIINVTRITRPKCSRYNYIYFNIQFNFITVFRISCRLYSSLCFYYSKIFIFK